MKFGDCERTIVNEKKNSRVINDTKSGDLKIKIITKEKEKPLTIRTDWSSVIDNETADERYEEIEGDFSRYDNDGFKSGTQSTKPKGRSITILGDSMVKDVQRHKMKRRLGKDKLYVRSFPGAKLECMRDYAKPSMRYNPNLVILHAGTNDLAERPANNIVSDIMKLALDLKCPENNVMVSELVGRADKHHSKVLNVNHLLKQECQAYGINLIEHKNIKVSDHLNFSGLHLNHHGTVELVRNFLDAIEC